LGLLGPLLTKQNESLGLWPEKFQAFSGPDRYKVKTLSLKMVLSKLFDPGQLFG
jgi:hypothetical protein